MNINLALFLLIGGLVGPLLAGDRPAALAGADTSGGVEWTPVIRGSSRKEKSDEPSTSDPITHQGPDHSIRPSGENVQISDVNKGSCTYCNASWGSRDKSWRLEHILLCAKIYRKKDRE